MKRARCFAWGVVAASIVGAAACGCRHPAQPMFGRIGRGVAVPLMLIKDLESGADALGTVVPFMCKADVVDASGNVAVAKGAVAYGKVVRSLGDAKAGRESGTISLDVSIDNISAVDGKELKLSVLPSGLQTSPMALNATNTAIVRKSEALDKAWAEPAVRVDLVKLAQLIGASKNSDLSDNPESDGLVRKISGELDLPFASRVSDAEIDKVVSLVGQIGTGRLDLEALGKASRSQIGAVIDLTQAVGYIEARLAAPDHRSIRACVGMPFVGYVIEDAKVRLPSRDPN